MIRFGRNGVSLGQPISFMQKRPFPKVLSPPFISKAVDPVVVGTVLTYVPGVYQDGTVTTWAWLANGVQFQLKGVTYMAVAGDVGKTITIRESAVNPRGTITTVTAGVLVT